VNTTDASADARNIGNSVRVRMNGAVTLTCMTRIHVSTS
jgi:hypothetical protein